uniref:Uncharacterized protein n=1 Tax=Timema shepardi TaxID=629360 RepID=A0A7R9ANH7_TIMSH|nr:unnamed protein product [Timema shepardi]
MAQSAELEHQSLARTFPKLKNKGSRDEKHASTTHPNGVGMTRWRIPSTPPPAQAHRDAPKGNNVSPETSRALTRKFHKAMAHNIVGQMKQQNLNIGPLGTREIFSSDTVSPRGAHGPSPDLFFYTPPLTSSHDTSLIVSQDNFTAHVGNVCRSVCFSFGKRTGGSARRPNECFVLEPSEMIVNDSWSNAGRPLRALVFQEKENSGLEVAPTPYVAS